MDEAKVVLMTEWPKIMTISNVSWLFPLISLSRKERSHMPTVEPGNRRGVHAARGQLKHPDPSKPDAIKVEASNSYY